MTTELQSVVLPVYQAYLDQLVAKPDDLICLIWGWQGDSKRMSAPQQVLRKQHALPFLFRPTDQEEKTVGYAALCGCIVHRDDPEFAPNEDWLRSHRVEALAGKTDWNMNARSFYVVTAATKLDVPIPFRRLTLVSKRRPLDPNMQRGYALVLLPENSRSWYEDAARRWEALEKRLPKSLRAGGRTFGLTSR